ncbi:hypothetical protein FRC03_001896 [Tulasnella sp. 419]|nr:hypothetical protein FRC03_001896 [Tulasnella sp. 419]
MNRRAADASYRPHGYGMSQSLQRARAPFRARNLITGGLLMGFAVSVWAYSISAVKQENFDDIDAEVLSASFNAEQSKKLSIEDEKKLMDKAEALGGVAAEVVESRVLASKELVEKKETSSGLPTNTSQRGILPRVLGTRFPQLLHPDSKTLVWGAPPVDKPSRIGDRTQTAF